ncbi:MAG TPA: rod shape-determining protein MreC [Candidatus Didemnitutus sp.]
MLPHRFDQTRPFVVLGVVLLVWLIVPVGVKRFTRSALFEIQAPLTVTQSYVQELQDFWSTRLHTRDELYQKGHDLAGLLAQYDFSLQQNESLRAEILRLENLLKLPPMPSYRLEPARVARRDFSGWWQHMVIRKGSNYNIPVGAPVVFSGGVVGRIIEVHEYTSVVDMVTSPTFRVAASPEGDNRPVSYQGGDNETFSSPTGTVEFVPLDIFATPQQPKHLVTSGLGGVFPAGLTIGDITKLDPSNDGMFKSGEVRLDDRLGALSEVTILVPLNTDQM